MLTLENLDSFQKISDYRKMRNALRSLSIISIIISMFAIFFGVTAIMSEMSFSFLFLLMGFLAFIGFFFLFSGIWFIIKPKPLGIILSSIPCACLAFFLLSSAFFPGHPVGKAVLIALGLGLISWIFRNFCRRGILSLNPSQGSLKEFNEIVKEIISAKVKDSKDIIEFQTKGNPFQQIWKGKLMAGLGVFVKGRGKDVLFAKKLDVNIVSQAKIMFRKTIRIKFKIKDRLLEVEISPECLNKLETWE